MIDEHEHAEMSTNIRMAVADNLRILRRSSHISQSELADKTGLSLNTIGSIERAVRFPSPESMAALCIALKCDPWVMLREV